MTIGSYFMTAEESDAATGRMVVEYSEAKRKLATLTAEAPRIGQVLTNFGHNLQSQAIAYSGMLPPDVNVILSDREKVARLVKDLNDTKATIDRLRPQIKNLGLEG